MSCAISTIFLLLATAAAYLGGVETAAQRGFLTEAFQMCVHEGISRVPGLHNQCRRIASHISQTGGHHPGPTATERATAQVIPGVIGKIRLATILHPLNALLQKDRSWK